MSAVESYGPAVRDLRRNLDIANITNVDVIGGDAVREFPDEDADVLVVDPPRAGLAPEAIDLIASTSARDVAYVSCGPRHPRPRPAPFCGGGHLPSRLGHAGRSVPADLPLRDRGEAHARIGEHPGHLGAKRMA